jgi:hypothetical protein
MNFKNIRQKKLIIVNFLNCDKSYKTKSIIYKKVRELKLHKLKTQKKFKIKNKNKNNKG